jgi:hypothetical protein
VDNSSLNNKLSGDFELNFFKNDIILISTAKNASTYIMYNLEKESNDRLSFSIFENKIIIDRYEYESEKKLYKKLEHIDKTFLTNFLLNEEEELFNILKSNKFKKYIITRDVEERFISTMQEMLSVIVDDCGGLSKCLNDLGLKYTLPQHLYESESEKLSVELLENFFHISVDIYEKSFIKNDALKYFDDIHFSPFFSTLSDILIKENCKNIFLLDINELKNFLLSNNIKLKSENKNSTNYNKSTFDISKFREIFQYLFLIYIKHEKIGLSTLESKLNYV